ncbi:hypothetical protein AJ79_04606 [Helicocarpus griseus UAMH5409]|uniref:GED domain-containing protein n=1 Tax=Helicocarpus griseus UAMH5409 TaxID=1447875 RepID=A0A2B7XJK6_9EURO|nr:hypothetical protein AJ79_04606 [Helicocarpus griseus UAMH5409]
MDTFDPLSLHLLQSKGQAELLARLDELRSLGFRRQLALPQLVICGDQNSGKSSVFEAITGVALPTNNGLCTRFATEVVLRRSNEVSASVKIRPGPNASPDHRHKLGIFARSHNWLQDIPKLYSEARLIMGLILDGNYSLDILQLEVSGPSLPDLTVVDLPGLINTPGKHQTMEDVAIVQNLTEAYMRNPRSIILAVVSAENPISQQIVLHMTKSCGSRTMAIITKPDALEPGSASEENYFARVKNQDTPLRLGWHALMNNDTTERRSLHFQRDDMENLFFTTTIPWKTLSPNCIGIESLRNRLSKILLGQVESQLSDMSTELQQDLELNRTLLAKLGPDRKSNTAQRLYLTTIAERFQALSRSASAGEYHDPYFRYHPQTSVRRLRSIVRNWAEDFAADMEERGHSYNIYDDSTSDGPQQALVQLTSDDPQPVGRSSFIRGLAELLRQSRGRELKGLANSQVVGELFIRYSLKWTNMAKAHVFELWKKVKRFLDDLLHHIAGATVGEAIFREILDQEMSNKLEELNRKVDELAAPYKRIIPSTLNRKLTAKIYRLRARSGSNSTDGTHEDVVDVNFCSEVLDCMESYYAVALPVFIDNVAGLAVENCLVQGLEDLLSPSKVAQLTNEQLERVAADSEDTRMARMHLAEKVKVLEFAVSSCRRCEIIGFQASAQNYREPPKNDLNEYVKSTPDPLTPNELPTPENSPSEPSNPPLSPDSAEKSPGEDVYIHPSRSSDESGRSGSEGSLTDATAPSPVTCLSPPPKSPARTGSTSGSSQKDSLTKVSTRTAMRKRILKKPATSLMEDKQIPWSPEPNFPRKSETSKAAFPSEVFMFSPSRCVLVSNRAACI